LSDCDCSTRRWLNNCSTHETPPGGGRSMSQLSSPARSPARSVRRRPAFSASALPSACVRRDVLGGGRGSLRWRSAHPQSFRRRAQPSSV
jgi:hypothetical protein